MPLSFIRKGDRRLAATAIGLTFWGEVSGRKIVGLGSAVLRCGDYCQNASTDCGRKFLPSGDNGCQVGIDTPDSAKQNAKTVCGVFATFYLVAG